MNVYAPVSAEGYEFINCIDAADYQVMGALDRSPRIQSWKPVAVTRITYDEGKDLAPSDFPWFASSALVMRHTAVEALGDLLECGEVLPLSVADGVELTVFNAPTIDALDVERSSLIMFPGTERIMKIKQVAFHASLVEGRHIFRLSTFSGATYVSEHFVERVVSAELKGLSFLRAWSS